MPESIKYKALEDYLRSEVTITMTYSEIENILGFKLPDSAYDHPAWWDNNTHNHTQMWSWANAGWEVVDKKLGEYVIFKKVR